MTATELENLLRRLASDFCDLPCYVVLRSDQPPADLLPIDAWGAFGSRFDLALRPWLESQGRWQGRGPAVFVDDVAIETDARQLAGDDIDLAIELRRQRLLAILVHEAAHALEHPFDATEPTEVETTASVARIKKLCRAYERPFAAPMAGHGETFIRFALHLAHRYEAATGDRIPLNLAIDFERYQLTHPVAYRAALRQEVELFPDAPLSALRRLSPPQEFAALFEADFAAWFKQQKQKTAS